MSNLRNKNISINTEIDFIKSSKYYNVKTYKDIEKLRNSIQNILNHNRGIVVNKATGLNARITKETVKKVIYPTIKSNFNALRKKYIDDLNAACYLKELIDNTSIWNYDLNAYNYYSYSNFVAESINYNYVWVIN